MPTYDLDFVTELWLRAKLASVAGIVTIIGVNSQTNSAQIYKEVAEQQGAHYPMCLYNLQSEGQPLSETNPKRVVWVEALWQVKFEGLADQANKLSEANELAIAALTATHHETTAYGHIAECQFVRYSNSPIETLEGGTRVTQKGAVYRTRTQRI